MLFLLIHSSMKGEGGGGGVNLRPGVLIAILAL